MNATVQDVEVSQLAWSALSIREIEAELVSLDQPAYRARQIFRSLHVNNVGAWEHATDLPIRLRSELAVRRDLRSLRIADAQRSKLDGSIKLLMQAADGGLVEGVLMQSHGGPLSRVTACVSSQIGCPAACTFCASGIDGFTRNLSTEEMTDQVELLANQSPSRKRIDNLVFMGMGEPFLNYSRVMDAINRLRDPGTLYLGSRRITVSTVGIVPGIVRFAEEPGEINLAISLHAPNDELRSRLVPYNKRYQISDILAATRLYIGKTGRRVSFEYVLLAGSNDSPTLARDLGRLLKPLRPHVHVNLIPWNPFPEIAFGRATRQVAEAFASTVRGAGVNATIRYSKGLDIDAACGQLRRRAGLAATAMSS